MAYQIVQNHRILVCTALAHDRWTKTTSKNKTNKIIAGARNSIKRTLPVHGTIGRRSATRCNMSHIHERHMYYFFTLLFYKVIWSNDYQVFICVAQTVYINENRPDTSQADEKHYSQKYSGEKGRGYAMFIIVGDHNRSHQCEET